jgi:hypothetical protein
LHDQALLLAARSSLASPPHVEFIDVYEVYRA